MKFKRGDTVRYLEGFGHDRIGRTAVVTNSYTDPTNIERIDLTWDDQRETFGIEVGRFELAD